MSITLFSKLVNFILSLSIIFTILLHIFDISLIRVVPELFPFYAVMLVVLIFHLIFIKNDRGVIKYVLANPDIIINGNKFLFITWGVFSMLNHLLITTFYIPFVQLLTGAFFIMGGFLIPLTYILLSVILTIRLSKTKN